MPTILGEKKLPRRHFLGLSLAGVPAFARAQSGEPRIETVRGAIAASDLGIVLMHEHVLVDFGGIPPDGREAVRHDPEEVFRVALPHLERVRALGCRTLVDCTPAYIGRDARLLARLASASGLQIVTNTGYYGAASDRYVPPHAYVESADDLARRWTEESRSGIGATGIKPGIMKIGVDAGPLSEIDAKIVRAAARTYRQTGLRIASHTGDGTAALAELDLLREEGVPASALIWVHASSEKLDEPRIEAARRGAWIELDGIRPETLERHLALVTGLVERGFLRQILVSQDAGWYHVGEKGGGTFRSYETIFTRFVPELTSRGIGDDAIRTLLVDNPRRALSRSI